MDTDGRRAEEPERELQRLRKRVDELEAAEARLKDLERRFHSFIRDSAYAYYELDLAGNIVFANRKASEMVGCPEDRIVGRPVSDFIVEEDLQRALADLQEALTIQNTGVREYRIKTPSGETRHIEANAIPLCEGDGPKGFMCAGRDITDRIRAQEERARLEEERRQAQKLEAIGTLAAGIAHDFNNLLTGILAYAILLKNQAEPGEMVRRAAETIERAANRGAELTGQLLGFARKGKLRDVAVNVHMLLAEVASILERTIDKRIEIRQELQADRPYAKGDPGQLQQVILNLAVNARDAMPTGGTLTFATRVADAAEDERLGRHGLPSGKYLVISVSDTGVGIPDDIRDKVFDPFFTTKGKDGTGMGLATVYGIVQNHGGAVDLARSRVGRGTTFSMYLPLSAEKGPEQDAPPPPSAGAGTILLVDDEELVLAATGDILVSLGYEVLVARDGAEALESYRSRMEEIDLVILDLMMPGMGGREVFDALKKTDPEVKALVMTGYGLDGAAEELLDAGLCGIIKKPYTPSELSLAIEKAMRGRRQEERT